MFFSNHFPKEIFSERGIVLDMEYCPTDGIIDSVEGIVATQMRKTATKTLYENRS